MSLHLSRFALGLSCLSVSCRTDEVFNVVVEPTSTTSNDFVSVAVVVGTVGNDLGS